MAVSSGVNKDSGRRRGNEEMEEERRGKKIEHQREAEERVIDDQETQVGR